MATKVVLHRAAIERLKQHTDRVIYARVMPPMEADARRRAPVDTGWLRGNVEAKHLRRWRYELRASTTGKGEYAAPVELGHRIVTQDGRTVGYVPPQPFLRPAAYRKRG